MLALLGVVLMPVDYRAGAAISHPHTIVHLIGDLASDSLDHHDHAHHWNQAPTTAPPPSPPNPPSTGLIEPPAPIPFMVDFASTNWSLDASVLTVDGDEPSLSPWSGSSARIAYSVLLPIAAFIRFRWCVHRLVWATAAGWAGVVPLPEIPPPRAVWE